MTDHLADLRELTVKRDALAKQAAETEMFWRWRIQAAVKAGLSVPEIAEVAGISRQRVYQIRDGRR